MTESFFGTDYSHTLESLNAFGSDSSEPHLGDQSNCRDLTHRSCDGRGDINDDDLKRLRNRLASRKCRERKRLKIINLQHRIVELVVENEMLKTRLEQIYRKKTTILEKVV